MGGALYFYHLFTVRLVFRLDVGFLKAIAFLLVYGFQIDRDKESGNTEGCQHNESPLVVVRHQDAFLAGLDCCLCSDNGGIVGVGAFEDIANQCREQAEADILNPEDSCVGRADNLLVNQLRH